MGWRGPRSAIPAKGDRGISESAIRRFYFETHRAHDIAAVAPSPLRLGPADQASRSLVGGENGGHVEMAECLISVRRVKIISNQKAENAREPRKPPCPHFRGCLADMKSRRAGEYREQLDYLTQDACRSRSFC